METTTLLLAVLAGQLLTGAMAWAVAVLVLNLERRPVIHFAAFCILCLAAVVSVFYQTPDGRLLIAISNVFLVAAMVAVCRGVLLIMRLRPDDWLLLAMLAGVALVGAADVLQGLPVYLRGAFVAVCIAGLMGYTVWRVSRPAMREYGLLFTLFCCAPIVVTGAFFAARAVRLLLRGSTPEQALLSNPEPSNVAMFLSFTALVLMFNLSLLYVVMARLVRRLQELSQRDALTGLWNRRALMDRLEQLHALYRRHGHGYAILVIDLDHFKRINDNYGHDAGDRVLCHFAKVAADLLRRDDVLARLGGEEFCVLLPMVDERSATIAAERLRWAIAGLPADINGEMLNLTVSVGVAMVQPTDSSGSELLQRADAAMYDAKRAGRDRVGGAVAGVEVTAPPLLRS